jgi:hypothetical protein
MWELYNGVLRDIEKMIKQQDAYAPCDDAMQLRNQCVALQESREFSSFLLLKVGMSVLLPFSYVKDIIE